MSELQGVRGQGHTARSCEVDDPVQRVVAVEPLEEIDQASRYYDDQAQMCWEPGAIPKGARDLCSASARALQAVSLSHSSSPPATPLKVITVNAWAYRASGWKRIFFEASDVEDRITGLAHFIKERDPDLVFVQEVWQERWWRQLTEQLAENGYLPEGDQHQLYFSTLGSGNTDLGLLSRYPLKEARFLSFQWQGSDYVECGRRLDDEEHVTGVGMATMVLPHGQEVLLVNNHPMHRRSGEEGAGDYRAGLSAERAVQQLETRAAWRYHGEGRAVISAGDFNMDPKQWEYREVFAPLNPELRGSYEHLAGQVQPGLAQPGEELCSYCEGNPLSEGGTEGVLDHVFGNEWVGIQGARLHSPRDPALTDHEILEATLTVHPRPIRSRHPVIHASDLPGAAYVSILDDLRDTSFHWYCYLTDFNGDRLEASIGSLEAYLSTARIREHLLEPNGAFVAVNMLSEPF